MADQTKAEVREALTAAEAEKKRLERIVSGFDPEARAVDRCVQALDALPKRQRSSSLYSNSRETVSDEAMVTRILGFIAQRYGLPDPHREMRHLADELQKVRAERDALAMSLDQIRSSLRPDVETYANHGYYR